MVVKAQGTIYTQNPTPNRAVPFAGFVPVDELPQPKKPDPQTTAPAEKKKLEDLTAKTNRVLIKLRSAFPFELFPDEVVVDENKVNVILHYFFSSRQVRSVAYSDIRDVTVETGYLFATLTIIAGIPGEPAFNIEYLPVDEAIKARRLITGLKLAHSEGIDLNKIEPNYLLQKLEEIGESK